MTFEQQRRRFVTFDLVEGLAVVVGFFSFFWLFDAFCGIVAWWIRITDINRFPLNSRVHRSKFGLGKWSGGWQLFFCSPQISPRFFWIMSNVNFPALSALKSSRPTGRDSGIRSQERRLGHQIIKLKAKTANGANAGPKRGAIRPALGHSNFDPDLKKTAKLHMSTYIYS